MSHRPEFTALINYLQRIPAVEVNDTPSRGFGSGIGDGIWWVKFSINVNHPLAWNAVQELAFVLNYISISERLPTTFMPVSPPPYLNGGPSDFLSWVIECPEDSLSPVEIMEWLESRLPRPVDDEAAWSEDE